MTIYFKSDKNFKLLFEWKNCTAIPRKEDLIEYNKHGYEINGISWVNPNEIHILLHQII